MVLERILIYCKRNDISIAAFERLCNIGNGTIKKWKYTKPSIKSLEKIATATGIPISFWIDGGDIFGN